MLSIILPETEEFPGAKLDFEHSLVSLSKWESLHEKVFFGKEPMDHEETKSYIQQMLLTQDAPEDWVEQLKKEHFDGFTAYINSKQSATWFREDKGKRQSAEVITNELIYHWMISFNIPFDPCETWHVNRLMTLIKICGIKQTKPQKMSKEAQREHDRKLNAERRKQLGTSG